MSAARVKQAVQVCLRTRPTSHFAHDNLKVDPTKNTVSVRIPRSELTQPDVPAPVATLSATGGASASASAVPNNAVEDWNFRFDHVLHNAEQQSVYDTCAKDIVDSVLEGYNGTILAYGQTGAGKSFTMIGGTANYKYRGICPRAIAHIFSSVQARAGERDSIVKMSYLEIYNEQFYDLLTDSKPAAAAAGGAAAAANGEGNGRLVDLAVRDDEVTGQVQVKGLSVHTVTTEEHALKLLFHGEQNRARAVHAANKQSSRSHCILSIVIETRSRVESAGSGASGLHGTGVGGVAGSGGNGSGVKIGKLSLVDLAGSERVGKTGSQGRVLQEAKFINKSLSFLEQVVVALAAASAASSKAQRLASQAQAGLGATAAQAAEAQAAADKAAATIPFRRSKLTNVLRDALGGNCATRLIACVVAERASLDETVSTCKFASRMMRVTNEPTQNVQADPTQQLRAYEKQIRDLKQELAMHDTLANRGGAGQVVYDPYTPEQTVELQQQLQRYIRGELPGDELEFTTVRHAREVFRAFRNIVRGLEQQLAAAQAAPPAAAPKVEAIGGGAKGKGAAASLSVGGDDVKSRPNSGAAPAGKGGKGAAAAAAAQAAQAAAAAAEAARRSPAPPEFVGDLDESKGGFHVGVAPSHAKPAVMAAVGSASSPKKGAPLSPAAAGGSKFTGSSARSPVPSGKGTPPPIRAVAAGGGYAEPLPAAQQAGGKGAGNALLHPSQQGGVSMPPLSESAAFDVYKLQHSDGKSVNAQWTVARQESKAARAELNRVTRTLNDIKRDIDRCHAQVTAQRTARLAEQARSGVAVAADGVEVMDEDEYALLQALKQHKARYSDLYSGERTRLVARLSNAEQQANALKHRFVSSFLEWFHATGGHLNAPANSTYSAVGGAGAAGKGALPPLQQQKEADDDIWGVGVPLGGTGGGFDIGGVGAGARLGTADANGDVLDDGEKFDRLEEQRLAAEDPDAVSFYKALKASTGGGGGGVGGAGAALGAGGKKKSAVAAKKTMPPNPPRRTMKL